MWIPFDEKKKMQWLRQLLMRCVASPAAEEGAEGAAEGGEEVAPAPPAAPPEPELKPRARPVAKLTRQLSLPTNLTAAFAPGGVAFVLPPAAKLGLASTDTGYTACEACGDVRNRLGVCGACTARAMCSRMVEGAGRKVFLPEGWLKLKRRLTIEVLDVLPGVASGAHVVEIVASASVPGSERVGVAMVGVATERDYFMTVPAVTTDGVHTLYLLQSPNMVYFVRGVFCHPGGD